MVVACPLLGGQGGRRCGCKPRSGSRRGLRRRRWRGGYGSHRTRRTRGGGAAARAGKSPWRPGPGRGGVPAERGAAGAAAGRAGSRAGYLGLERGPAVDAGTGHDTDRAAVPCPVPAARDVVPAVPAGVQPAGPGAPGAGAGRGRDRAVAGGDLGEGTRLAAATGEYVCFEDEAGQNLRPPRARTWARRGHTPVARVSDKGPGRVSVAAWCASSPARGVACSTGSASTAAAGASAARCPKQTTPA